MKMASYLGKTVAEIEEMPFNEYTEWVAFFNIEQERSRDGK